MSSSLVRTYLSRRMLAVLLLGFSSGFPLALTSDTLALWLTDHGMSLGAIGAFALVATPYTFKFAWAPLLDRFAPPFLDRRRGWIVVSQLGLAAALVGMAFSSPGGSLMGLAVTATMAAFASATQDIVIDAWRTESFEGDEAAAGTSVHVTGYRVGMLATGAGTLLLHGSGMDWGTVYAWSAAAVVVGIAGVLLAQPAPRGTPPATFADAVVDPFRDFLLRRRTPDAGGANVSAPARYAEPVSPFPAVSAGAVALLLFVVLFRLPDIVAGHMTMPFLRKTGFRDEDIAAVRQGLGVFVTIAGVLAGGLIAARVGLRKALWTYGILQAVSNLGWWALAHAGANIAALTAVVVVENVCAGLVTAGFLAFLQSQCSPGMAATQFALLTSLMALPRTFLGAPSGWLAERLGWPGFFAASVLLGLPGLLLLPFLTFRAGDGRPQGAAPTRTSGDPVPGTSSPAGDLVLGTVSPGSS